MWQHLVQDYLNKDGVLDAWCERGNVGALHQVARHRRQLHHLSVAHHQKDVRIKKLARSFSVHIKKAGHKLFVPLKKAGQKLFVPIKKLDRIFLYP